MRLSALLALFVLLTIGGTAQTKRAKKTVAPAPAAVPHADGAPWPLETLKVEGNNNFTAEQILEVARLKIGQSVAKPEFEAARERLLITGAFDRVGYRFDPAKDNQGYDATIEVVEMGQLYAVRFEDLPATDEQLRSYLHQKDPLFGAKIPATKAEVDRYAKWLSEYLGTLNFHEPIAGKVTSEAEQELMVTFRPTTMQPSVARVKFLNTGDVPAQTVETAMFGVAVGFVFTEPRFRLLLDSSVRPLYEAKGMIKVAFPKITTAPAKDVKGLEVTVTVEQGPVYNLGRVRFVGSDTPPEDLADMVQLKKKAAVNFDDVKAGQSAIEKNMRRQGYLQARAEVKRVLDDADKIVDLTFQITPGPQVRFHQLDIVGLDLETEPVIRKLWGMEPGKPFNADYPNHFLDRIKGGGYFDNLKSTRAESKVNPKDNTADVTLYFNK